MSKDVFYQFTVRDTSPDSPTIGHGVWISDETLTSALIEGLVAASGKPVVPYIRAQPANDVDEIALIKLALRNSQSEVDGLRKLQAARNRAIVETDDDGEFVLSPAQRRDLTSEYQADGARLRSAEDERLSREVELAALVERTAQDRDGVHVDSILRFVAELREPESSPGRALLRDAIRSLRFTTSALHHHGYRGLRISFTGLMVFHDGSTAYEVPFSGAEEVGKRWSEMRADALGGLAKLRSGVPLRGPSQKKTGGGTDPVGVIAEMLGKRAPAFTEGAVSDPALLQLRMAIRYPMAVEGEPLPIPTVLSVSAMPNVAEFRNVEALVARIRTLTAESKSAKWLAISGEREARLLIAASQNGFVRTESFGKAELRVTRTAIARTERALNWSWDADGARLRPCFTCGGLLRAAMRIREVSGYLCLGCHFDEAGVHWPNRYLQYIGFPGLWASTLPELDVLGKFTNTSPTLDTASVTPVPGRVQNSPTELTRSTVSAICEDYVEHRGTLRQIMSRYDISSMELYKLLDSEGVPRRVSRTEKPSGRRRRSIRRPRPEQLGPDQAAVREWAIRSGFPVKPSGRLSPKVVEAWKEAHEK